MLLSQIVAATARASHKSLFAF